MIKTYGVQYLGSKAKIVDVIIDTIKDLPIKTAIDVFTGTTRVAQALRQNNIQVTTSDLADASRVYSSTFIQQTNTTHLQPHIDFMNTLTGYKGWLTKNYSGGDKWSDPSGEGRYIHPKNSMKADAARDYIETLTLSQTDKDTLICSIIFAINKVNNSVGQQQAYLKEWCSRSLEDIKFELLPSIKGPIGSHLTGDCLNLTYPEADLAYLDPPYTPTVAYHTYYHIWDSIVLWDKPVTEGKAKRRIDRVKRTKQKNSYNKDFLDIPWYDIKNKDNITLNKAFQAFEVMVKSLKVKYIMISYSNESIISKEDLFALLSRYGSTQVYEIDHKRNVMGAIGKSTAGNKVITNNPNVTEYIFLLEKN